MKWNIICPYCKNAFSARLERVMNGKQKSCGCKEKERFGRYASQRKKFNTYDLESQTYGIGYDENGKAFYFDKEDFTKIEPFYWTYNEKGYVVSRTKYRTDGTIRMHRLVVECPDELSVDHICGVKNNNQKSNIRICTIGENDLNKGVLPNWNIRVNQSSVNVLKHLRRRYLLVKLQKKNILKNFHIATLKKYMQTA